MTQAHKFGNYIICMTAWQPWDEDGITRALNKFWLTIATTSFKLYPNNHETKYRQIMRRKWYACVVVVEPMVIRTGTKRAIILIPNSSKYGLTRCESFFPHTLALKIESIKEEHEAHAIIVPLQRNKSISIIFVNSYPPHMLEWVIWRKRTQILYLLCYTTNDYPIQRLIKLLNDIKSKSVFWFA